MNFVFNEYAFMEYMEDKFNGFENPFLRQLVSNVVNYALHNKTQRNNSMIYFLFATIPEVELGEIAQFFDDDCLDESHLSEKRQWAEEHGNKYNVKNDNGDVLAAVNGALCLYGSEDIRVVSDHDTGMINVEIIEQGEWMNRVAAIDCCEIERLKRSLDKKGVDYDFN